LNLLAVVNSLMKSIYVHLKLKYQILFFQYLEDMKVNPFISVNERFTDVYQWFYAFTVKRVDAFYHIFRNSWYISDYFYWNFVMKDKMCMHLDCHTQRCTYNHSVIKNFALIFSMNIRKYIPIKHIIPAYHSDLNSKRKCLTQFFWVYKRKLKYKERKS
jgi:hypothetical protein